MSSVADIQALRQEIRALQLELDRVESRVSELSSQLAGVARLTRRLIGNDDLAELIDFMLQAYTIALALHAALVALQAARAAAGDPLAMLQAIVAGGTFIVSLANMMEIQRPRY